MGQHLQSSASCQGRERDPPLAGDSTEPALPAGVTSVPFILLQVDGENVGGNEVTEQPALVPKDLQE